jgi:hypothetical protein
VSGEGPKLSGDAHGPEVSHELTERHPSLRPVQQHRHDHGERRVGNALGQRDDRGVHARQLVDEDDDRSVGPAPEDREGKGGRLERVPFEAGREPDRR